MADEERQFILWFRSKDWSDQYKYLKDLRRQLTEKDKQIEELKAQRQECENQYQEKVDEIIELETQIETLANTNIKAQDTISELNAQIEVLLKNKTSVIAAMCMKNLSDVIAKLESQVEKMTCCGNHVIYHTTECDSCNNYELCWKSKEKRK